MATGVGSFKRGQYHGLAGEDWCARPWGHGVYVNVGGKDMKGPLMKFSLR